MNINLTSISQRHTNTANNISRHRHALLLNTYSTFSQYNGTNKDLVINPTVDIRMFHRLERTVYSQLSYRGLQLLGRQYKLH